MNEENKSKEIQGKNVLSLQNLFWGVFGLGGFVWGFLLGDLCLLSLLVGKILPFLNKVRRQLCVFGNEHQLFLNEGSLQSIS